MRGTERSLQIFIYHVKCFILWQNDFLPKKSIPCPSKNKLHICFKKTYSLSFFLWEITFYFYYFNTIILFYSVFQLILLFNISIYLTLNAIEFYHNCL